jgi:hypothetical protein
LGVFSLAAQALLAMAVLGLAVRGLWALLFVAPLDLAPFREALAMAVGSGQLGLGRALCEASRPALVARHALVGLDALQRGAALLPALEESRLELEHGLDCGQTALRALGRMATPLSFITIIIELGQASGDRSLRALQRGLPLRAALDHALDAFALGLSTTIVAMAALSILRRAARTQEVALGAVVPLLAAPAARSSAFTPPRTAV